MNQETLHRFIVLAKKKLKGDWVLLGGTLLYFFNHDYRTTTDIDFVPLGRGKSNQDLLQTFEIATELGLPVETINSAALYFLEKIPNYQDELLVIHKWKSGRIYRPNLYLFFVLKVARLSESDYLDCLEFLKIELEEKTPQFLMRVTDFLKKALKDSDRKDHERRENIKKLIERVVLLTKAPKVRS